MRKAKRLMAAALAALMLTSCGSSFETFEHTQVVNLSFSWWGKDVRHGYTTKAIEVFESQNDGVKIYPKYAEWAGFKDRMDTKISAGSEADVMQMNYNWLYEYTGKGYEFYDLETLSDTIKLSNFDSDVLDYGRIDGKLMGIPISMNMQTVYFNKTLLDKYSLSVPQTWEDYFKAAEALKKDGLYVLRMSKSSVWHFCIAYAEQKVGKRLLDEKGNIGFDEKDMQVLFDFYISMLEKGVTIPIDDRDRKDFEESKAAGTVMWISDAQYYVAPCRDKGNSIIVADYPKAEHAGIYGWYTKPTSLYCISRDTQYPEQSARLVDFLLSSEEMAKLRGLENGVPVSKSTLEVLDANDMIDGIQLDADNMRKKHSDSIKLLSPFTETAAFIETFNTQAMLIWSGETDSQSAAHELYTVMTKTINEIIQ